MSAHMPLGVSDANLQKFLRNLRYSYIFNAICKKIDIFEILKTIDE